MNPKRLLAALAISTAFVVIAAFSYQGRAAFLASPPQVNASDEQDTVTAQIKDLQKQVAELKARLGEPRIVAAGTATWLIPASQKNDTSVRVKLPREIVDGLGKDYIVLLTNRFPGGFPFFDPCWKVAPDGFDIMLID
ncbi:MAG TPA: hypothetical protein VE988_20295, partial [Gemmataceae bacterium]|nr:hypothetical protein [Gemmataceae bacterium]